MDNYFSIFSITKNKWVTGTLENGHVQYGDSPKSFSKTDLQIEIFTKSIANRTGDDLKIYILFHNGLLIKPSLVYEMGKYTSSLSPKVAAFIHNTAIRFGDSREDKLQIAKDLSEGLSNALTEK